MKKSLLFIFIILLSGLVKINAQEFHGGLIGGLAATQVAGDTYSGFKKAGIFFGGYVNLDLSEKSSLQMELTYFQKGSRVNPDSSSNYQQYLFRANYIEVPFLYQFKAGKFRIFAGPSMGILMGHYEEVNYQRLDGGTSYNQPAPLTLQVNLGFRFNISEKFGVDFRTNNSILNIRKNNVTGDVWRIWTYGQFHDSLVLSLFYQFR